MSKRIDRVGEKYLTNQGYEIEIIEYFNRLKCTIIFKSGVILKEIRYEHIVNGDVKNPKHPTVCGIGYLGIGKYEPYVGKKLTLLYNTWKHMLERAYYKLHQQKFPTYKDVTVCEEWHNFQVFAKWHEENHKPHMAGWQLDKDILFKGNKIYSPETCCFVPAEINYIFVKADSIRGKYPIGVHVDNRRNKYIATITLNNEPKHLGTFDTPEEAFQTYKIAKEEYIKEVADKWRGQITEPCYDAMYNYQVEITD